MSVPFSFDSLAVPGPACPSEWNLLLTYSSYMFQRDLMCSMERSQGRDCLETHMTCPIVHVPWGSLLVTSDIP